MTNETPGQITDRPEQPGRPKMLTITATARRLGVTPRMVAEMIDAGELGVFRFGSHVRVAEPDVDNALIRAYHPSRHDMEVA